MPARNTLLQQERVELAAFAKNASRSVFSIASGLEISSKTVKVRPQEAAPEIDQSAFVFMPIFEHKNGLKNIGDKRNNFSL